MFEIEYRNVWSLSIKVLFLSTVHSFLSNVLIYTLFLRQNVTGLTYSLLPPFESHFQCWFCVTWYWQGLCSDGLGLSTSGHEEDGTGIHAEEEHLKTASCLQMRSRKWEHCLCLALAKMLQLLVSWSGTSALWTDKRPTPYIQERFSEEQTIFQRVSYHSDCFALVGTD